MVPDDGKDGSGGGSTTTPAGAGASGHSGGPSQANGNTSTAEVDFSEYLWMEHEEEYNQQVLRELEDEEIMNYYYNLIEPDSDEEPEALRQIPGGSNTVSASNRQVEDASVSEVTQGMKQLAFNSEHKYNPDAQEFVPGKLYQPQPTPGSAPPQPESDDKQ